MMTITTLGSRQRAPEWMDQPDVGRSEHEQALRGLGRVNRISRTAAQVWQPIARLSERAGGAPIRVLDIASGGGDVAMAIARRARAAGRDIQVEGCDRSAAAVGFAQERARARGLDVKFFTLDALTDPLPTGFDVMTSTLFLHHLEEAEAIGLLARMGQAARLVVIDDLIRSRLGYALAVAGCQLLSRSRLVHYDGPLSVASAFTTREARGLAERAGLAGATIRRHWPERYLLAWERP